MVTEKASSSDLYWAYFIDVKVILNSHSESLTGTQICLPPDNFLSVWGHETIYRFTFLHRILMVEQILMLCDLCS